MLLDALQNTNRIFVVFFFVLSQFGLVNKSTAFVINYYGIMLAILGFNVLR